MMVLVIRTGGLGDCLLTLPVIKRIKEKHHGSPVHILGNSVMRETAGFSGFVADFHDIEQAGFSHIYASSPPDTSLTAFFLSFTHVYFFSATDTPEILSRRVMSAGACVCYVHDPQPPSGLTSHIVEHLMKIVPEAEKVVFDPVKTDPFLASVAGTAHPDHIVMHPGSGGRVKNWPPERFLALADAVPEPVTIILGPVECERETGTRFKGTRHRIVTPATLTELAEYLAHASIFIGNDSGVGHLAALMGIPVVALFGPSNPAIWHPLGKSVTTIRSPDGTMSGITVDEVLEAVDRLRSGPGAR